MTGPPIQPGSGAQSPPPAGYGYVPGTDHPQYRPPGDGRIAIPVWALVAFLVFVLVAVAALAALAVTLVTPAPAGPDCVPGRPCAPPPPGPPGPGPVATASPPAATPEPSASPGSVSPPLVTSPVATNAALGYSVEYTDGWWEPEPADPRDIRLRIPSPDQGNPLLWIHAAPAEEATPDQLIAQQLAALTSNIVGLTTDERPANAVMDPEIGFVRGNRAVYTGNVDSPQGPGDPVVIFMEASTDGRLTVAAALVLVGDFTLDTSGEGYPAWYRRLADGVLNSFSWPQP